MAPCVASPHPKTGRLEAKQLRTFLLSKRAAIQRKKYKKTARLKFHFRCCRR